MNFVFTLCVQYLYRSWPQRITMATNCNITTIYCWVVDWNNGTNPNCSAIYK